MKLIFLLKLCFVLLFIKSEAQLNNYWMLGYNQTGIPNPSGMIYSIDFRNGQIDFDTAYLKPFSFRETCSVICDSAGNLLCYTNGIALMNALHDTMLNGNNLAPSQAMSFGGNNIVGMIVSQPCALLPGFQPELYYLFHQTRYVYTGQYGSYSDTLFYSVVDMTLDSGRGAVTSKNQVIWAGNLFSRDLINYGGMAACKHANGRDWWLLLHKDSTNTFMRFLFTPNGIQGPYFQTIGDSVKYIMGQSAFSPDGNHFAYINPVSKVHLFDFDRCSGLLNNYRNLQNIFNPNQGSVGLAFSANSNYLYASALIKIYQWDVKVPNTAATKIVVADYDTFPCGPFINYYYLMQLAADNKIYVSSPNSNYCMTYIDNPDAQGLACNVINHGLSLPYYNGTTVPYYPNFYLGADSSSICDSLTSVFEIDEGNKKQKVTVNPNPSKGETTITSPLPITSLNLLTVTGSVVKAPQTPKAGTNSVVVDVKDLPKGIYFVQVVTEKGMAVKKLIKM